MGIWDRILSIEEIASMAKCQSHLTAVGEILWLF